MHTTETHDDIETCEHGIPVPDGRFHWADGTGCDDCTEQAVERAEFYRNGGV